MGWDFFTFYASTDWLPANRALEVIIWKFNEWSLMMLLLLVLWLFGSENKNNRFQRSSRLVSRLVVGDDASLAAKKSSWTCHPFLLIANFPVKWTLNVAGRIKNSLVFRIITNLPTRSLSPKWNFKFFLLRWICVCSQGANWTAKLFFWKKIQNAYRRNYCKSDRRNDVRSVFCLTSHGVSAQKMKSLAFLRVRSWPLPLSCFTAAE